MPTPLFGRLVAVAAVATLAGCGGPADIKKVTVSGTVTYKSKPLSSGMLKFSGPNGFYSAAVVQPDGTFTVTDVIPGEIKVGIMDAPQGSGSSDGKAAAAPKVTPVSLPEKYREPETSGLVYTVTADTKTLAIDLK